MRMSGAGRKADVNHDVPNGRFLAEAVEELSERSDRIRSVELDSYVLFLSECGSDILFILESNFVAALQFGPSQSSSTASAKERKFGLLPAHHGVAGHAWPILL